MGLEIHDRVQVRPVSSGVVQAALVMLRAVVLEMVLGPLGKD